MPCDNWQSPGKTPLLSWRQLSQWKAVDSWFTPAFPTSFSPLWKEFFPCSVGTCIELATVADSKLKFFAWEIPAFGLFQVNILVACATEQRTPPTALGSVSKQVQTRKQALCWSPLFWLPWNLKACLSPGGLHRWLSGKESACHYRRGGFDPRIRKIP